LVICWLIVIKIYDFIVWYIKGTSNIIIDVLLRKPSRPLNKEDRKEKGDIKD
jgi:hypothetical protein